MSQATRPPWMQERAGARGPQAVAQLRELRAAERLLYADPAELRALSDRRLASVIEAARTVEPYRTLWAGIDARVRSTADLSALPVTDRDDLQGAPVEARLTRPRDSLEERITSGSTGTPLMTLRSPEESRYQDAMTWRTWRVQGIPADARRLVIDVDRRRQEAEFDVAGQTLSMSLPESAAAVADVIRSYGVEVLVSMPSLLLDVADVLGKTQMKGIVTYGEVRSSADISALREIYGTQPMDSYGATEVQIVSWECPSGSGYHVNVDSVVVELLDKEGRTVPPGERGEVVATALWNRSAPIVRYRLGDIAALVSEPCPCGITLPLMGIVEGRTLDWVIARDGRRVSPYRLFLDALLGEELGQTIRRSRVIQRTIDDFVVEIVWASRRRHDVLDRVEPAFSWVMGAPVRVEWREVPEIPLAPSEKFRQVISLVGAAGR